MTYAEVLPQYETSVNLACGHEYRAFATSTNQKHPARGLLPGAMALPKKRDRLSANVAIYRKFNNTQCEVACYGSGNDFVCRITRNDQKPNASEWSDGYHPPPDGGMLWIRSLNGQPLVTGFVQKDLFPNCDDLHDALEKIQQLLPVDQAQAKVNISVVGGRSIQKLEFNGEQIDIRYTP